MSRMLARTVARALAVAGALLPAGASAQDADAPAGVRLSWTRADGAEACPAASALAADVAYRLGRDPFAGPATQYIEVVIRRDRARWTASLYVRDSSGTLTGAREIHSEAETCAPIRSAAALAIALIIDPDAALVLPPGPPAAAPSPEAAPGPVRPRPREPRVAARRGRGADVVGFDGRALAAVGALPGLAAGVALAVDAQVSPRVALAAALWFFPQVRTAAPDERYAFGLTAGALSACAAPLLRPSVTLAACAGLLVGAVHGVAYAFTPTPPAEQPWLAVTAGARLTVAVAGPLAAVAAVDLVVPLTRYRFYVENVAGSAFEQAAVGGVGQLGLALRFR